MEDEAFEMEETIAGPEAERFFGRIEKNFSKLSELAYHFSNLQQATLMCKDATALAVVSFGHNTIKLSGSYVLILSEKDFFRLARLIEQSKEEECELLCLNCVMRKGKRNANRPHRSSRGNERSQGMA